MLLYLELLIRNGLMVRIDGAVLRYLDDAESSVALKYFRALAFDSFDKRAVIP